MTERKKGNGSVTYSWGDGRLRKMRADEIQEFDQLSEFKKE